MMVAAARVVNAMQDVTAAEEPASDLAVSVCQIVGERSAAGTDVAGVVALAAEMSNAIPIPGSVTRASAICPQYSPVIPSK